MNGVYLGIGGNKGDRLKNLKKCIVKIEAHIGQVKNQSSVYETAPWGNENQATFYNQVIKVETDLSPSQLMKKCLHIEEKLGRKRTKKWGPRIMDIDILFFNDSIINKKELCIPHPRLAERNFVLVPLNEIAPHYIHPVYRKKVFTLLRDCKDPLSIKMIGETSR